MYKGYRIEPNNTGYVNFDFYKPDDELISGNGKTIYDCKEQIDEIEHIFKKEIKDSKEYIHDMFMGKIKIPQDILDNSFEKTKDKILKWIPDKK